MNPLPIDAVLPETLSALEDHANAVLSAEPGAGKTTRVPLALLRAPWLAGKKVIMLEPRRLAAQRAAGYMAAQIGEKPGETVGYRIRGDAALSKRTRIEVLTEGILTRFLQEDPALGGAGIVIFDEYHERSIHADLGLALTLDVQKHLRPELRILIMSATLDGLALSGLLGDAAIVKSEGRMYPVDTVYLSSIHEGRIEPLIVSTVLRALRESEGDILAFLPGQREIREAESLLLAKDLPPGVAVRTLFGDAPFEHQKAALTPSAKGTRKVILSTSIAETSLTIDGVRVVIDSGLARGPRFDPRRGMSGLVTSPVSRAVADQRRGRAGRQYPGRCYRLWTEAEHARLPDFPQPEILLADLASLALELARWGAPEGQGLCFLDPPPSAHLSQARELLAGLGALDSGGKLTTHGRAMAGLPVHPRLAHMLLKGKELGSGALACDVGALLDERDLLRGEADGDIDLASRVYVLRKGDSRHSYALERALEQARRLRDLIGVRSAHQGEERLGLLLALAYPERVAKRREGKADRYQLAGGSGALLPKGSPLSREKYLAVGEVDGIGSEVKVFSAAALTEADIREGFREQLRTGEEVYWDSRQEAVVARTVTRFGAIELSHIQTTPGGEVAAALILGVIRQSGLGILPWTKEAISLRDRGEWLMRAGLAVSDWPDLSEARLTSTMEEWLGPYLEGIVRRRELDRLDMTRIIRSLFSFQQLQLIEKLAPTHITVPSGSRIPLDYGQGTSPVLAVRLQEMFGLGETPAVGGGKVKVLLHLLSPARRPLAVTQDLRSFWKNSYPDVRKDMRGRYPKHHWPEDPLLARPTKRAKRK